MIQRVFFLLFGFGVITHYGFSQSTININCTDEPWVNRYTEDETRNKLLTDACVHIYAQQYDSARFCLQQALDISDDAYFQNILQKINEAIKEQKSSSPDITVVPAQSVKVGATDVTKSNTSQQTISSGNNPGDTQKVNAPSTEVAKTLPASGESKTNSPDILVYPSNQPSGESTGVNISPAQKTETPQVVEKSNPGSGNVKKTSSEVDTKPAVSETNSHPPTKTNQETTVAISKTEPSAESSLETVKAFSAVELESFQTKGKQKVADLERYIQKISDKKSSQSESVSDINNALKLFDTEEHYVEVSSLSYPEKPKYLIRRYLERVRAFNYDKVLIEWAEFQYASKFRKAPDGNYYGFIKFRQRFTAMKDGKVAYRDITDKVISVIIKANQLAVEGTKKENFEVFLGDIQVAQTFKE